jgi:CDP-glucose 4,6-dehydratase
VEKLGLSRDFWRGRRVFVTGHTGFKGSWLSLWLARAGAKISGFSLPPPTTPSLFETAGVGKIIAASVLADVRDASAVREAMRAADPEIVFHMAAQPLVRDSYTDPIGTYATNVMGTAHVLDAVRACRAVRAVVVVTTDKCYQNNEWPWAYRETDPLGGHDPYSNSKACAELVTAAYRSSFFSPAQYGDKHRVALASVRAGNVFGGGDWAKDRLIPDFVRAQLGGSPLDIRNPDAVRPWQFVLEPLSGYLAVAERLHEHGVDFGEAYNFGPRDEDARTVSWLLEYLGGRWGGVDAWRHDKAQHPHEARFLRLDCSKAREKLGWVARLPLAHGLDWTVDWYKKSARGADARELCLAQIQRFEETDAR